MTVHCILHVFTVVITYPHFGVDVIASDLLIGRNACLVVQTSTACEEALLSRSGPLVVTVVEAVVLMCNLREHSLDHRVLQHKVVTIGQLYDCRKCRAVSTGNWSSFSDSNSDHIFLENNFFKIKINYELKLNFE